MMTMEVMMKMMTTKLHILICIYNTFLAIFIGFGKTPVKKEKEKKEVLDGGKVPSCTFEVSYT